MKRRLSTEEIIERLRNPVKHKEAQTTAAVVAASSQKEENKQLRSSKKDFPILVIGGVCVFLLLITMFFFLKAKNRAEDMVAALDPGQVEGLHVEGNEFNPKQNITYIQVQEGQDRNVTIENSGSTLPIISRSNVKTFTKDNYEMIGDAPWALTTNFAANIEDPGLVRILLDNNDMIQAFVMRPDVAPLLEDPAMLLAFAQDEASLADFFESDTVQAVLANEQMLRNTVGSRFVGFLLISKSGKYFREHLPEALAVINASPTLRGLRQNPAVRKAIEENPKLGPLASQLLAESAAPQETSKKTTTASTSQKTKTTKKKKK